jgi:hypothetical protein
MIPSDSERKHSYVEREIAKGNKIIISSIQKRNSLILTILQRKLSELKEMQAK